MIANNLKKNKIYEYILYFFIFSFLGWILETFYSFVVLGYFTKRGFLYGPLCPIYGYGAIILIVFLSKYRNKALKLFTYSAIIFSIFEYYVSYILEALFQEHWWDYSNDFFNLNGRISIFYSFAWGIIAIIFIGYVYPFFEKKINTIISKINNKLLVIGIDFLVIFFIFDTVFSCIKYIN
jgi:uncharacterized membrane protein